MAYNSIIEMAVSQSLTSRIAASAAEQGVDDPLGWAQTYRWVLAASPGWATSWDSAKAAETINQNPDTGQRDDVITDAMILAAVQALLP